MIFTLLFISGVEIFVVLLVVLLLFGAKKIPEVARGLGKGLHEFQKATNDIKREINNHSGDILNEGKKIKEDIKKETDEIKNSLNTNINDPKA